MDRDLRRNKRQAPMTWQEEARYLQSPVRRAIQALAGTKNAYRCLSNDPDQWNKTKEEFAEDMRQLWEMSRHVPDDARPAFAEVFDRAIRHFDELKEDAETSRGILMRTKANVEEAEEALRDCSSDSRPLVPPRA